jgi:hypothetical protein
MSEEELAMIPKITQIDTDQVSKGPNSVEVDESKNPPQVRTPAPLRPELQKAADASWAHNEEAYRYLGR